MFTSATASGWPARDPVGSKYSCGPAIVSKQATKALSAADVPASRKRSWGGEEQGVPFALMIAFRMEQLSDTTPILGISGKSATRGIHGMGERCVFMPLS